MSKETKILILKYIIIVVIGFLICLTNLLTKGSFTKLINYVDGMFIAGFSIFLIGMLSVVNHLGTFDIFSFMFNNVKNGHRQTFAQYSDNKKIIRSKKKLYYLPYFAVATVFLIVALFLRAMI